MSKTSVTHAGLYTVHAESWTDYEKVVITRVEIHAAGHHVMHARASATLHPDDQFNVTVGIELSKARAIAKCFAHLDRSLADLHRQQRKMKAHAYRLVQGRLVEGRVARPNPLLDVR